MKSTSLVQLTKSSKENTQLVLKDDNIIDTLCKTDDHQSLEDKQTTIWTKTHSRNVQADLQGYLKEEFGELTYNDWVPSMMSNSKQDQYLNSYKELLARRDKEFLYHYIQLNLY